MTTDTRLAIEYIAGFFDGEGHVGTHGRTAENRSDPQWELSFSNTHREVLERIRAALDKGRIYTVPRSSPQHKTCYQLRIGGRRQVREVLERMLPHLIVKQEQAQRAISWARVEPEPWQVGENNGNAALSNGQVEELRNRYAAGGITQMQLAREYGVHQTTISWITRGASRRDAAGPLTPRMRREDY